MSVKRVNEDMLSKDQSDKDETLSTVIFIEQSLSLIQRASKWRPHSRVRACKSRDISSIINPVSS